mgnify:CR=1 FL=1
MKKILVVEDEAAIRDFIVINLQRAGYIVVQADCGEAAMREYNLSSKDFDIILLDVMMPDQDGFSLCREIRNNNKTVGIIMLTAKAQEMDKVNGLMLGADDYITKPFSPSELTARIDSLYRRVEIAKNIDKTDELSELVSGSFILNVKNRNLQKDGRSIDITQTEFLMLEYFIKNPGKLLTRTDILTRIWGEEYAGEEKKVDVNIRRLRIKIEENPAHPRHIITIWGLGYKWEA